MDEADRPSRDEDEHPIPGSEAPVGDPESEGTSSAAAQVDPLAEAADALQGATAALNEAAAEPAGSHMEATAPDAPMAEEASPAQSSPGTEPEAPAVAAGAPEKAEASPPEAPVREEAPVGETVGDETAVGGEAPAGETVGEVTAVGEVGAERTVPEEVAGEETQLSLEAMVGQLAEEMPPEEVLATPGEASGEATEAEAEPEPEPESEEATEAGVEAVVVGREEPVLARSRLAGKLPFYVYVGVWVVFVGTMAYLIWPAASRPFVEANNYAILVFGGLALLAAGLVVALVTYFVLRAGTSPEERTGLVMAILLRATGSMAIGVLIWWAGLIALDMHRIGRIG